VGTDETMRKSMDSIYQKKKGRKDSRILCQCFVLLNVDSKNWIWAKERRNIGM
jgi:hypothetical protein